MSGFTYIFGDAIAPRIKVGKVDGNDVSAITKRRRQIQQEKSNGELEPVRLVLLVAFRGTDKERLIQDGLAKFDRRGEWFTASQEVEEYVNWLRTQWSAWVNEKCGPDDVPEPHLLTPDFDTRRLPLDEPDPSKLMQDWDVMDNGPLNGTRWNKLVRPKPPHQDYYTPSEVVQSAREAMGGIDLDAASHWYANRVHQIPDYFHKYRDAMIHEWHGRVWLNPPYGDNAPWFRRIVEEMDAGHIEQLCMLSPVWAFSTKIATPVVERASGFILLCPTPSFWGRERSKNGMESRISEVPIFGSNHPHGILYVGSDPARFFRAFRESGCPMRLGAGIYDIDDAFALNENG